MSLPSVSHLFNIVVEIQHFPAKPEVRVGSIICAVETSGSAAESQEIAQPLPVYPPAGLEDAVGMAEEHRLMVGLEEDKIELVGAASHDQVQTTQVEVPTQITGLRKRRGAFQAGQHVADQRPEPIPGNGNPVALP